MIEKYKPLFIHLNPASIPEVVAHMQKYLTTHTFVTVEEFGEQFQEYIDAHPEIIKVGSVNGLTGNVVLTSENITMTGESSDTIGAVIGDILEEASSTGETVDDLAIDMDTAKTNIATLQSDVTTLEAVFTGATDEASGTKGLVPAPTNTQTQQYLKATGNFETVSAGEVASSAVSGVGSVEAALTVINSGYTENRPGDLPLSGYVLNTANTLYEKTIENFSGLYLLNLFAIGDLSSETTVDAWVETDGGFRWPVCKGKFTLYFNGVASVVLNRAYFSFKMTSNVKPLTVNLRYQILKLK